jgi:hypothetical protein
MAVGDSNLPAGRARTRSLERDHVGVIAMWTSPDLKIKIGEQYSLAVGNSDYVQVCTPSQRVGKVDSTPNYRVVVAGE